MITRSARARRARGVTLIELVTVVAIVGILSAIAIPSYRSYTIRVKRTDAKTELLALAGRLERCFTRSNDYRIEQTGSATACVTLNYNNPEGTYRFTGTIAATTFTLTATPIGSQIADTTRSTRCGSLTLTNTGVQGVTGATMTAQNCWQGRGG